MSPGTSGSAVCAVYIVFVLCCFLIGIFVLTGFSKTRPKTRVGTGATPWSKTRGPCPSLLGTFSQPVLHTSSTAVLLSMQMHRGDGCYCFSTADPFLGLHKVLAPFLNLAAMAHMPIGRVGPQLFSACSGPEISGSEDRHRGRFFKRSRPSTIFQTET